MPDRPFHEVTSSAVHRRGRTLKWPGIVNTVSQFGDCERSMSSSSGSAIEAARTRRRPVSTKQWGTTAAERTHQHEKQFAGVSNDGFDGQLLPRQFTQSW
jgi:hypothetical protein